VATDPWQVAVSSINRTMKKAIHDIAQEALPATDLLYIPSKLHKRRNQSLYNINMRKGVRTEGLGGLSYLVWQALFRDSPGPKKNGNQTPKEPVSG
jgi:hypothetical protein